jgi:hypothetical protein
MTQARLNAVDQIINTLMANIPGSGGEAYRQGMGVPPRLPPGESMTSYSPTHEEDMRMEDEQKRVDDNAFKDMVGDFDVVQGSPEGDMIGDFDVVRGMDEEVMQQILQQYIGPDSDVDYAGTTTPSGERRVKLSPRGTQPDAKYQNIDANLSVPEGSLDNDLFRQIIMKLVDEYTSRSTKGLKQ